MAAGIQPPLKKLKLADPKRSPAAPSKTDVDGDYYDRVRHPVFVLTAFAHKDSLNGKGLEVMPPYSYEAQGTGQADDDDDDEIEQDGFVDADRAPAVVAGKIILVKRKTCQFCCVGPTPYMSPLMSPEYVFWPDNKKVPDNCPKCRRVLFLKKKE